MREFPWHVIEAIAVLLFVVARLVRQGKTVEHIIQALRSMGEK